MASEDQPSQTDGDSLARCSHGALMFACEHADCPEQNAYFEAQRSAFEDHAQSLLSGFMLGDE